MPEPAQRIAEAVLVGHGERDVVPVRRAARSLVRSEVNEDGDAADVEERVGLGTASRRRAQHPLVELDHPRDVRREERDLGDPGHEGTIGQC